MNRGLWIVLTVSVVVLNTFDLHAELTTMNSVIFQRSVHFNDPDGQEVHVEPGIYRVDLADGQAIWLIPADDKPLLLIQASETTHEKTLGSGLVLNHQEGDDTVHVLVLLPDRKGLDAVGTFSGIRPRAGSFPVLGGAQISTALTAQLKKPLPQLQVAGTPPAPILQSPSPNHVLQNPTVRFVWMAGQGNPSQTIFELCVTERGKACSMPGAEKYPSLPGSASSFSPPNGLPLRFQGKELAWTVKACAPNPHIKLTGGSPAVSCQSATARPIAWILPAPALSRPTGSVSSLRPNFAWFQVVGAQSYLLCVSKPGVSCPKEPTNTPNTLVVTRPPHSTYYTPPDNQDLARFAGQTVHWTAAACNLAFSCVYQSNIRALTFPAPVQAIPITAAPNLTAPAHGAFLPGRQHTFSWSPVPNAFTYKLCIAPPGVACGTKGAWETPGLGTTTAGSTIPTWLWGGGTPKQLNWTVAACNQTGQCLYQQQVRAFTVSEGVDEAFKILAYNTYMRPDDFRFPDGQEERSRQLPAHLSGYDAIIFSELFDDSIRADLLRSIRPEYPHQTRVVGEDRGLEQDGGVVIVSKWPIEAAPDAQRQRLFGDVCSNEGALLDDCQADKGVIYARVLKNGHPYHLFGTHVQSGHSRERVSVRSLQFGIIKSFIDSKGIPACQPVIVGGDFNVKRTAPGGGVSGELRTTLAILNSSEPIGLSYYGFGAQTYSCTYCFGLNPLAGDQEEGAQHLDYLLSSKLHLQPRGSHLRVIRPLAPQSWGVRNGFGVNDLSDHFPVVGEFTYMWPVGTGC